MAAQMLTKVVGYILVCLTVLVVTPSCGLGGSENAPDTSTV